MMTKPSHPWRQHGLALAVVLILLLIMTLLGLASMRGTLLQERMSGSLNDRSLAFQAAEAALRQGELDAQGRPEPPPPTTPPSLPPTVIDCRPSASIPCPQVRTDPAFWANANIPLTPTFTNVTPPQYIIEFMAKDVQEPDKKLCNTTEVPPPPCNILWNYYRITARSQQAGRAAVVLQSVFKAR